MKSNAVNEIKLRSSIIEIEFLFFLYTHPKTETLILALSVYYIIQQQILTE
jgi:hypothetical protein